MWKQIALLLVVCSAGCVPPPTRVGTEGYRVPADTAVTCARQCESIGMALGSVVMVSYSVGCVCNVKGAPAPSGGAAAATALLMMDQQMMDRQPATTEPASNLHMDF